jgi:hypothetical protein
MIIFYHMQETVVYNFHDENNKYVGQLKLQSGDDAEKVKWTDLNSSQTFWKSCGFFT